MEVERILKSGCARLDIVHDIIECDRGCFILYYPRGQLAA